VQLKLRLEVLQVAVAMVVKCHERSGAAVWQQWRLKP